MESLYDISANRKNNILNKGFDYENQIFDRSLSPFIMQEKKRNNILKSFEKLIYFSIEKIKYIKTFYNFTVDRNYKHLN